MIPVPGSDWATTLGGQDMSEFMVRVMGEGDYLVPRAQGEQLRERLTEADALPLEERNAAVRELIAEVTRDGNEAPEGSAPDLVLMLRPPEPPGPAPKSPGDDRTPYDPDLAHHRPPDPAGRGVGDPHKALKDIDPTDPWRG